LIVSGPIVAVPGSETDALVQITDVYATVAELAGVTPGTVPTEDSLSFVPSLLDPTIPGSREMVFIESFRVGPGPGADLPHKYAVIDPIWKLIRPEGGGFQLYDMTSATAEVADLNATGVLNDEQQAAFDRLMAYVPSIFIP
ncbi:MAG: hypothetical protein GWP91_24765, partial [Rhodobacterales bacterium]|nr:hypothetical protein [Rhodobacterales bacterium]